MNKQKETKEEIEQELNQYQDIQYEWKFGGNHNRILATLGGLKYIFFVPKTPSDGRSIPNLKAFIKRTLRQDGHLRK